MKRLLIALLLVACALPFFSLTLFQGGEVRSAIVIPQGATEPVRFAAKELSLWMGKSAGLEWRIYEGEAPAGLVPIYVGDSAAARNAGFDREALSTDGYLLGANDECVFLAGRDYPGGILQGFIHPYRWVELWNEELKLNALGEMGTYFGVRDFLETFLGVRFYMKGELGTVCPTRDELTLEPFCRTNAPAFGYRYAFTSFFSEYPEDALWFRRAGFGGDSPRDINHAYWQMEDQKDAHPEYFALIDGRRDTDSRSVLVHWGGNYCLTNPGLQKAWVEKICEYFETHPQNILYPLSPNDGTERVCECENCQALVDPSMGEDGKFSNYVWTFTNNIAREVGKRFPDRLIGTFAYEHYRRPPTKPAQLAPNVATLICHNQREQVDPARKAHIRGVLKEWCSRLKHVYSYTYPHADYWKPLRGYPAFYPSLLQDDIRFAHEIGIEGFFMESEQRMAASDEFNTFKIWHPGLSHLTAYVTSKLEWDPNLDLQALLDEYYRLFYGPAEKPMRAFWEKAEHICTTRPFVFTLNIHPSTLYSDDDVREFFALLDQSLALTEPGSDYHKRIQLIRDEMEPYSGLQLHPSERLRRPAKFPFLADEAVDPAQGPDAPIWQKAQAETFADTNGKDIDIPTEFYTLADKEGLSLLFRCQEPDTEKLVANAQGRDQGMPWEDDCVEVFFCSQDGARGIQFILTANGTLWDGKWTSAQGGIDPRWNGAAQCHVSRKDGEWTAIVKVPWSDLEATPETAGSLKANFFRTRVADGPQPVYSCLVPIMGYHHKSPDFFAPIRVQISNPQ